MRRVSQFPAEREKNLSVSLTVTEEMAKEFEREWHYWRLLETEHAKHQHTLRLSKEFNVHLEAVNRYICVRFFCLS
jgi:hypothetical protein